MDSHSRSQDRGHPGTIVGTPDVRGFLIIPHTVGEQTYTGRTTHTIDVTRATELVGSRTTISVTIYHP